MGYVNSLEGRHQQRPYHWKETPFSKSSLLRSICTFQDVEEAWKNFSPQKKSFFSVPKHLLVKKGEIKYMLMWLSLLVFLVLDPFPPIPSHLALFTRMPAWMKDLKSSWRQGTWCHHDAGLIHENTLRIMWLGFLQSQDHRAQANKNCCESIQRRYRWSFVGIAIDKSLNSFAHKPVHACEDILAC